ncbi:hypothetical protein C882_1402 [Caenispirillum salinarum AK4]|uniref:Uncharacterized protein n=1 Tax=Caenispirillum salinarum AK4 TaxID=1238182 RepID=K9HG00_9PROT|nr:hypothetical protein [Caenispirillum salinarum]EKV27556.1 hypothetical protein C882_1402 [Caenispirillum salinarum AK4]
MYVQPVPYPSQDAIAGAAVAAAAAAMTQQPQTQQALTPQGEATEDPVAITAAHAAQEQSAQEAERARRMVPVEADPDRGRTVNEMA